MNGGCSGVQHPDQGGAFKDQAGLDPSQVRRPEGAKRCAWKAEPEDAGERQAREQNPVVVTTPPDAWDGKLQQQRTEEADAVIPADPALGKLRRCNVPEPRHNQHSHNNR